MLPPRRVKHCKLANRQLRRVYRAAGDLIADLGRRKVLQQQNEVSAVRGPGAVVAARGPQFDLIGDLFIEPCLGLIKTEDISDASVIRRIGRELRDKRCRRVGLCLVVA